MLPLKALENWLADHLGRFEVRSAQKMSGGAIQENWLLDTDKGPFVLRTDAPSTLSTSHSRPQEFAILGIAHGAGLTVPQPLALCEDTSVTGRPFYLMEYKPGQANARKLVRDAALPEFGPALVHQLGHELARLHAIRPLLPELGFLPIPQTPAQSRINGYRQDLDALPEPHPVLEYALSWLEAHQPHAQNVTLCHTDFRSGNFLVAEGRLSAILDWEFASWSDPMEDIGWLCARCWRFGNDHLAVGGLGKLADFLSGYTAAGGQSIDADALSFWQVMAETRWAVIALQQAERCHNGEATLELALSAPLAAEMEMNILNLIGAHR